MVFLRISGDPMRKNAWHSALPIPEACLVVVPAKSPFSRAYENCCASGVYNYGTLSKRLNARHTGLHD